MIKKMMLAVLVVAMLIVAGYGGLVWNNSRSVAPPSQQQIDTSWEKSVSWLMNNRAKILRDKNPALWWMIGQSAEASGDSRLRALYDEFLQEFSVDNAGSLWEMFFAPARFWGISIPQSVYASFPDYQQYFIFSLTCGRDIAADPLIIAQHETDFCPKSHPISPACVTHQLMGFRLQQRSGCDRVPELDARIAKLQDAVESQLTWDPRAVDVYLQRVLMLVDSGAVERVKPRWVQSVLEAQLADGSWSNLQPLIPVGDGRYFGFDARLVGVGPVQADFHATAQGVWLTSLLRRGVVDPVMATEAAAR